MPTTLTALRVLVAEELGGGSLTALSTSAAGNAGGTTLVDASLAGYGNDRFENWWVVLGSGTNPIQQVSDFVSSSGTITVREAFGAPTQVASLTAYELHRYDPTQIRLALNEAIKSCYADGSLWQPVRDETLVVDNLLLNSDFETFAAGVHTNWTLGGAGASVAQSATILWHGADAAAVTAGSGAAATYGQAINTTPGNAQLYRPAQRSFKFRGKVYATAASTARLQITDGTTTTSHSYHTGADGWEDQEVTLTPGTTYSTVTARLQVAASGVAYIDAASCHVDPLSRYTIPTTIEHGPTRVSVLASRYKQNPPYEPVGGWHVEQDGATRYLIFDQLQSPGARLRLEGRGELTALTSTEASTTEVVVPQSRLLVLKAAEIMMRRLAQAASVGQAGGYRERAAEMAAQYAAELDKPWLKTHQSVLVRPRSW